MKKGKRVALYARVSTNDKSQDTEMQVSELREFANLRNFNEVALFEDKGFTGSTTKRPGLQALLKAAKQRKFDVVLVWKLDRFARSLKELLNMIHELNEFGVDFCSFKDSLDLSTSQGQLMLHMLGAFAQFEHDLIKTRVKSGLENARRKGKKLGRPKVHNQIEIRRLRDLGLTHRAIADKLGIGKGSVQRALSDWTKNPPKTNPVNS